MKKFSMLAAFFLVLQLILPVSLSASAEETTEALNYLALGDSLAAGMNEKGEIGLGYADFIAQYFSSDDEPIHYNKGFAYPGYTTVNVLNDIENNVTKPIYNLEGQSQQTAKIQEAIKEADLITLSAGANDVLKNVKRTEAGDFTYDAVGVLQSIQQVSANYKKIFDSIYALNPDVDILVMGLYNPYPYLQDTTMQGQLNGLVTTINNSIKTVVEANDGIYSDVSALIAENVQTFLTNPNNIHLNEAGYEAVGILMAEEYVSAILADIVIDEAPFSDIQYHWAKQYIDVAYYYGMMKGNEDGTFTPDVKVTRAQAISVIVRAFELEATKAAPFKDISQYSQDTQKEIAAAYEAGIIRENNGIFNPKGQITRAQLALMLLRLSNSFVGEEYVPETIAPFKDIVNFDRETQVAITFLYDIGVIDGTSATTFSPKDNLTRAQLAKILVLTMSEE